MRRQIRPLAALILSLPLAAPSLAQEKNPGQERPTLELSLEEAVKRALENNLDIVVDRYNPESNAEAVRAAQGAYDPLLTSRLTKNSLTSPATNAFAGGAKVTTDTFTYNFGASQLFTSGGLLSLTFNNNRQDTNSVFSTFNPSYNSALTFNLTQPLLRNFRIDSSRRTLRVAKKNKEISDVQFHQTVVNTVANVKGLYYNILGAIDNLEAARKSLALAGKLLNENQIKVRVGTMAPLDVVAAQSEVATRESDVIIAESAVTDAEDALKRAIFPTNDPNTWALRILPTDRPKAEPVAVDTQAAITNALDKRTDVVAARKGLESAEITLQYTQNQALPQVDLVAAYGASGLGGDQLTRQTLGGPVISTVPGSYGDALSQTFGRDFPTWTLGVSISYPIRNRQAGASWAQARIARDQALASLHRLEIQVAADVRSAARAVETNLKLVASNQAARVLRERQLDAEEKRFAAGMSTNFNVTQAQRDLAVAEVAEIQAIANYRKSLVNFDRVQEAGTSGSGALITLTPGSSLSSTSAVRAGASLTGGSN